MDVKAMALQHHSQTVYGNVRYDEYIKIRD